MAGGDGQIEARDWLIKAWSNNLQWYANNSMIAVIWAISSRLRYTVENVKKVNVPDSRCNGQILWQKQMLADSSIQSVAESANKDCTVPNKRTRHEINGHEVYWLQSYYRSLKCLSQSQNCETKTTTLSHSNLQWTRSHKFLNSLS